MDVTRFLSFDKLMGQALVKIVYYLGMIGIALGCIGFIFAGFGMGGFMGGLGALIGAVIGGVIGLCFLRFACELYIVLFRMGDDIAAMRGGGTTMKPPGT
jgi:hypothetical protein